MKIVNRRSFLKYLSVAPAVAGLAPVAALAEDCKVEHPFMPPRSEYSGQCPVCGMVRPMWARTWVTFDELDGVSQTCSFHCLADWSLKSGSMPANVKLTVYHAPDTMIPAEEAHIVLGSNAAGTMSPVSKLVFADKKKAEEFASTCGGDVVSYATALEVARAGVLKENKMSVEKRIKKGKIVEPTEDDRCPVCGMHPVRYPYNKCQIQTKDKRVMHFCSSQCMFAFLDEPARYADAKVEPFLIWVVDRETGMWISGRTAYYVIGSDKAFGPMGYEAFPYNALADARDFASQNGGKAVIFGGVSIDKIVPGWNFATPGAN